MSEQQYLPRFSSQADVDEFVRVLETFERGEISPEKFRSFRLTRGVYGQRQPDVQMVRVKIPQGVLVPSQLEAIAEVTDTYSRGFCHLTTRQNIQLHFVKLANVEASLRILEAAGLTTREACGNTVRNVTADPMAGLTSDSLFDVRPYGEAITRHFLRADFDQALPRKFKIALSSSAADEAFGAINDIGLIARVRDGKRGFKVVAAGGLSTTPQNAITLHEFLPVEEVLDACEAVVRLFDKFGNRDNKHRARLKYVLKKFGEAKFREAYLEERAKIAERGGTKLSDLPTLDAPPPPPRQDLEDSIALTKVRGPGYLSWRASNVVNQVHEGYAAVYVRLILGDVTSAQLRAMAAIARKFGDGTVRTTLEQNFLLRFVPIGQLPALFAALDAAGLAKPDARTVTDVLSCPGAESCALAVTASRQLAMTIHERLDAAQGEAREAVALGRDAQIKISGCPNSCGQHHVADIGWHGAVRRVGDSLEKSAPVYQLHLGGGVDGEQGATFGRQIIKVPARRVAEAVERMLVLYKRERTEGETPRAFYRRVSAETITHLLQDLTVLDANTPESEFTDIGQDTGFVVQIGQGECAA
jgi:sulfite reductase beta subunit-like hemoprotein